MSRRDKLKSAKAELEQINTAISMILGGAQSYSMGSRSLTRANLDTLLKRKDRLEDLIASLSGGSGRFRRVVPIA